MKSLLYILIVLSFSFFSCKTKTSEKTETFKVWGNCEMCKKTIEDACNIDGVIKQEWNVESKLMTVTFDTTKLTLNTIQQQIANSGYDNMCMMVIARLMTNYLIVANMSENLSF